MSGISGLNHKPTKIKKNNLVLAEQDDLRYGLTYYTKSGLEFTKWIIRQRYVYGEYNKIKVKNEETQIEYKKYKEAIKGMVKQGLIYIEQDHKKVKK